MCTRFALECSTTNLKQFLAALKHHYRGLGVAKHPLARDPADPLPRSLWFFERYFQGLRNSPFGRTDIPKPKRALSYRETIKLIRSQPDTPHGRSMALAYGFAYLGALRISELLALQWRDVQITESGIILTIRFSKTKAGIDHVYLSTRSDELDSIPLLLRHLQCHKHRLDPTAPVFLHPTRPGKPMTKELFRNQLRNDVFYCLNENPTEFAGHSFRRGWITDAFEAGMSPELMQQHGRWATIESVFHYRDDRREYLRHLPSHTLGVFQMTSTSTFTPTIDHLRYQQV